MALAAVGVLMTFTALATATQSSWTQAQIFNQTDKAATGSMSFTHTYASSTTCSGGPGASSVACSSSPLALPQTDAIVNTGTVPSAALSQTVAVSSCEPVSFTNTNVATNPLVDRYGTSFNTPGPFAGAGSVTFDGTSGYATSVVAQTQPPAALSVGSVSKLGIWFKAPIGTSGPLFSFGASPSNGSGNVDRTLYLDSSGQLSFVWNTSGSNSVGPSTKSGGYADGAWHWAYVTMAGVSLVLATIPQVTLYVDGVQQAQTPLISLSGYTTYPGYWHLGYAPTATTGLSTAYFGGSLSDFVVINGLAQPNPATVPNTSSVFLASYGMAATEWWQLNDTGSTTFTGTLPVVGAGSGTTASAACKSVDLAWSFANPAGSATSSATSLYTWVTNPAAITPVAAPGPGATQSATLAVTNDAGYNAYVAGLHLLVPASSTISITPGAKWSLKFNWTPGTAVVLP